ncbi:MAG: hypothetical protein KF784_04750 [Fimbriimonadaceae bacterium]|nr:hypothetical protein [Fimbriimonadaceae bacterium]
MILYFATGKFTNTLKTLMKQWQPHLQQVVRPMNYAELFAQNRLPKATYIFSDHERMSPELLRMAAAYAEQMRPYGRIMNEPDKVLTRHGLLKKLSEQGKNRFRAYRLHEITPEIRFPVFLRADNDHKGPRSGLLQTFAEVEECAASLIAEGFEIHHLLVVEYMAEKGKDGAFRRYGAHRVGDRILPQILTFDSEWQVKGVGVRSPENAREELDYIRDNPHAQAVWESFQAANIEYGRMDYSVVDGQVQTYEINTNPLIMWRKGDVPRRGRRLVSAPFSKLFAAALLQLDSHGTGEFEVDKQRIAKATLRASLESDAEAAMATRA